MEKFDRSIIIALFAAVLGLIGYNWFQKRAYEAKIDELYNRVADVAQTIKINDGEYRKMMSVQKKDIIDAIDVSTQQGQDLKKMLDRTDAKIVSVTNTQVEIRKEVVEIKGIVNKPRPDGSWEFPVKKDQGLLGVDGSCFSGPTKDNTSGCTLTLGVKPWTLTQVVNQKEDGSWSVEAATPKEVSLNFGRVTVNPYVLKPEWWRNFNFTGQLQFNKNDGLFTAGAGYKFGSLNVSGLVTAGSAGESHIYYGLGFTWFPLEK